MLPQVWVGRVTPPRALSVSAPAARHPGALVSTFSFLQKEICPTSEPAIAPGSCLGED